MPFPDETESKMIQLVSRAEAAEARVAELEERVTKLREGILQAQQEGCACDFHLYKMDADLLTDEALDRYVTQEYALIKNKQVTYRYRQALEEIPLCATLEEAVRIASRAVWPEGEGAAT